jgi:hypothetical protein
MKIIFFFILFNNIFPCTENLNEEKDVFLEYVGNSYTCKDFVDGLCIAVNEMLDPSFF